jgi:hypothetical protein
MSQAESFGDLDGLQNGDHPFFILWFVQHNACVRMMARLARREIEPQDVEAAYLEEMEKIWSLNEDQLAVFPIRLTQRRRELWKNFQLARELARRANSSVLLDTVMRP